MITHYASYDKMRCSHRASGGDVVPVTWAADEAVTLGAAEERKINRDVMKMRNWVSDIADDSVSATTTRRLSLLSTSPLQHSQSPPYSDIPCNATYSQSSRLYVLWRSLPQETEVRPYHHLPVTCATTFTGYQTLPAGEQVPWSHCTVTFGRHVYLYVSSANCRYHLRCELRPNYTSRKLGYEYDMDL